VDSLGTRVQGSGSLSTLLSPFIMDIAVLIAVEASAGIS